MLIVTPPLFVLTTDILCWWCAEEIAVSGLVVRDIVESEDGEEVKYGAKRPISGPSATSKPYQTMCLRK